ncbi:FeoA family protein [Ructibacterium gallinarum]|uniref:Ferrous iron transport protein A n=1 Tax=Ructibacterium gallinarum TaxID=2779355 RepID=A0A9D5R8E0_9FIRM|nr:FeoA family protein [Ructibacterium gallinarum]MBE5039880.1 ferrous iron transport protein A [Ructibacterium gallinarum]
MPLSMAQMGENKTILKITGRDDIRQHLYHLGFAEGETVVVVSNRGGNLIVHVKDARIAIDRAMANRILV